NSTLFPYTTLFRSRGKDDHVEPEEDHRRGHRLAVLERAQEGAEGMITRRDLLGGLAATGGMGLLGLDARPATAEPPPETTRIRLSKVPSVCVAPQYVAEEFLTAEGFTDVRYVGEKGAGVGGIPLAK